MYTLVLFSLSLYSTFLHAIHQLSGFRASTCFLLFSRIIFCTCHLIVLVSFHHFSPVFISFRLQIFVSVTWEQHIHTNHAYSINKKRRLHGFAEPFELFHFAHIQILIEILPNSRKCRLHGIMLIGVMKYAYT